MPDSTCTTRGITIEVHSFFVPERSDPANKQWLFAYRIRVRNDSQVAVRLLNRHWVITDSDGEVEEVRGPGVVLSKDICHTSPHPLSRSDTI